MKTFIHKVYDASGNFIQTWTDVVNDPEYSQELNSGGSELVIQLARKSDDYGEEVDVKFNNIVKIYVQDNDASTPVLFFQGYIADYTPLFGANEYVEVIVLSFGSTLDNYIHAEDELADQSQTTGASTQDFGSPSTYLAQSFVPTVTSISSIDLKLHSAATTTVTLSIQGDVTGSPSGTTIGSTSKVIVDTTATVSRFTFGTPVAVTPASTYWMVLAA